MNKKQIVTRRAVAAGGACLTGLMLAACQAGAAVTTVAGAPTAPANTATAGATPSVGAGQGNGGALPVASSTGFNSGSTGTGTGGGVAACAGGQIHQSTAGMGAAMGNEGMVLIFTNTGSASCSLTGYAGAALTYPDGSRWNANRQMVGYMGGDGADKTPQTVVLKPGASASDLLTWTDVPSVTSCRGTESTSLLVTTPGTSSTEVIGKGLGGACGNFDVTPVVPGTAGSSHA